MSTFEPMTVVPGQRRNEHNGKHFWELAKPVGHALHFRTEALKRLYGGNVNMALADQDRGVRNASATKGRAFSAPFILKVPLYHGCNARVWGKIVFDRRRQEARERKKTMLQRLMDMASMRNAELAT